MSFLVLSHKEAQKRYHTFQPTQIVFIRNYKTDSDSKTWPWSVKGEIPLLDLQFDDKFDATVPQESYMSSTDILRLKNFLDLSPNARILFTCGGGISRSSACALTYLHLQNPLATPEEHFKTLLSVRDCALPNPHVMRMASKYLGLPEVYAKMVLDYRKKFELS